MDQSSIAEQSTRPVSDLQRFSCLTCRERKVRCNRHRPCSNCVKASKPCSFVPPVRGKRKRTKPLKEGLHAKLKRYEELLKSYGANIESTDDFDDSDSDTITVTAEIDGDVETRSRSQSDPYRLEETKPKLITKEGMSRYFDNALWSNLGDEFQHPEVGSLVELVDEPSVDEGRMFFEPERNCKYENLASLHPPSQILPKLRDIYIDRVDAMVKILHLPTFWIALTEGVRYPHNIPKSLEAMIFAFYFTVITTLAEDECQNLFQVQRSSMYSRYRIATRQALVNAEFLSTSSPMTLGAYALFTMCVRSSYRCETLFILSGIAIRLGRKMGLHRDGSSLGLSPFETEMRRRLWWHLVHVDFRTADVLGTRPSMDLATGDTKMPMNIEDDDFGPDMVDPPAERNGITSVAITLIKCEVFEALRRFSTTSPGDVRWEILYSAAVTVAKKDSIISRIEDHLENKYLRYCDPSNPLHTFVSIMIRSSICKLKLFAHNPRQFASSQAKISQSERDIVFTNSTKLLEYVTLIKGGRNGLEKYKWLIGTSHLWNTVLYVLIEIRHRKTGPEVDKTWKLIGVVFSLYPEVFEECTEAVFKTLGKWTLEVWDNYVEISKAEGLPEPLTPGYINMIRRCRRPTKQPLSRAKSTAADSNTITHNSFDYTQSQRYDCNLPDLEPFESYDFPNLVSFEMDQNEWIQWEQLVAEQNGFTQGNGI